MYTTRGAKGLNQATMTCPCLVVLKIKFCPKQRESSKCCVEGSARMRLAQVLTANMVRWSPSGWWNLLFFASACVCFSRGLQERESHACQTDQSTDEVKVGHCLAKIPIHFRTAESRLRSGRAGSVGTSRNTNVHGNMGLAVVRSLHRERTQK